jgi:acyl-CoA synthetase (AMP-forming)/AMP-acid ligase II
MYQTHTAALDNYRQNMGMKGFITLPLYHAHGLSILFRATESGKKIYLFSAALPLTQECLIDIMQQHDFEVFYGVPCEFKLLGETSEGIKSLARLRAAIYGGSACPQDTVDKLVSQGVNFISLYGT